MASQKKESSINKAIENMVLIHEFCFQHLRMGTEEKMWEEEEKMWEEEKIWEEEKMWREKQAGNISKA